MTPEVLRLAAFPLDGRGGNPAGVVMNAGALSSAEMQAIALEVGYSETVFITNESGSRLTVRYFAPEMEVDFCGHATIAAGVALGSARGPGNYVFETNTGDVGVDVSCSDSGIHAELTSQRAHVAPLSDALLGELLEILGFAADDLSPDFEPKIADAGNAHPVLVLKSNPTLESLEYDFNALQLLCREHRWPTVQLVVQESDTAWQSRNPFAFGGVYEDPATGSAALAFGVYLRELGAIQPGDSFELKQGFTMGRPSLLRVRVLADACKVSGTATTISS